MMVDMTKVVGVVKVVVDGKTPHLVLATGNMQHPAGHVSSAATGVGQRNANPPANKQAPVLRPDGD